MAIEDNLRTRFKNLIEDGGPLSIGEPEDGWCRDARHVAECRGWLVAADYAVSLVCPNPNDAYRNTVARILVRDEGAGGTINRTVGELTEILKRLLVDIEDGLLASIANQVTAETFDDLLDHAEKYLNDGRKDGSGILATAVFEDTVRRVGRSHGIDDRKLDAVISELAKQGIITGLDAKACRLAAGVRNEALHANWDEFELAHVSRTIETTRDLLKNHLAR